MFRRKKKDEAVEPVSGAEAPVAEVLADAADSTIPAIASPVEGTAARRAWMRSETSRVKKR